MIMDAENSLLWKDAAQCSHLSYLGYDCTPRLSLASCWTAAGFCPENWSGGENRCDITQHLGGLELLWDTSRHVRDWPARLLQSYFTCCLNTSTDSQSVWTAHSSTWSLLKLKHDVATIMLPMLFPNWVSECSLEMKQVNNAWEYSSGHEDVSCGRLVPNAGDAWPLPTTIGRSLCCLWIHRLTFPAIIFTYTKNRGN